MLILTANFLGLIPGMEAPTSDTGLTFTLGIICFIYYIYQGFAHQGVYTTCAASLVRCGGCCGFSCDRGL
jgi:F0F1-type ATP synthase membrane subunit a